MQATQTKLHINFTAPQMSMLTSTAPRNLFFSGQGGGKTFAQGVIAALIIKSAPGAVGMIAANTYGQLSDSTLSEIYKVWEKYFGLSEYSEQNPTGNFVSDRYPPGSWGWVGKFHPRPKKPHNKIFFKNGALVYTVSLDNYKAIDGRTISWCLLDETKDTKEEAVNMVILGRLRQRALYIKPGYKKQIRELLTGKKPIRSLTDLLPYTTDQETEGEKNSPICPLFMFTTPYKELWLLNFFGLLKDQEKIESCVFSKTDYFVKQSGNKKVVIASNYHNAANLPEGYISNLEEDLPPELIDLKIYGYPFGKSGNEYAKSFDRKIHVGGVSLMQNAMLHFTTDFNVNPYMSGLVIQLNYKKDVWQGHRGYVECRVLREYALKYPKNEAHYLGEALVAEFGHLLNKGFYLYGDASGNNRLGVKNTKTLFADVLNGLGNFKHFAQIRVPKSNPRYSHIGKGMLGRKSFLNILLSQKKPVRIIVDAGCTEFINDLAFCTEDVNGKLDKKKTKGVELRGHLLDAFQYFICHNKVFAPLAIVRTK